MMMVSLLFGTIGMAMFVYGKKSSRLVPLGVGVGVALMIVPYFLPSLILLLFVGGGLSVLPLVIPE